MNMTNKSNFKQIREILLSDKHDTDDDITDDQESDLDSDFDISATESDDTSLMNIYQKNLIYQIPIMVKMMFSRTVNRKQ